MTTKLDVQAASLWGKWGKETFGENGFDAYMFMRDPPEEFKVALKAFSFAYEAGRIAGLEIGLAGLTGILFCDEHIHSKMIPREEIGNYMAQLAALIKGGE